MLYRNSQPTLYSRHLWLITKRMLAQNFESVIVFAATLAINNLTAASISDLTVCEFEPSPVNNELSTSKIRGPKYIYSRHPQKITFTVLARTCSPALHSRHHGQKTNSLLASNSMYMYITESLWQYRTQCWL